LVLSIQDDHYEDALYSFVQALLKISDVTYLSRDRVRSTFMEDFRTFMQERVPESRRRFDWYDAGHDPEGKYVVDCRVNGVARPLLVYALPNDDKVRDATIDLLQFERWRLPFRWGIRGSGGDQSEGSGPIQRCLRKAVFQPRGQ
jgi:hypothetical protein